MDFPKRGQVWLVSLDPTIGSEIGKSRPCLVISKNSKAKCNQIRTIDRKRFVRFLNSVSENKNLWVYTHSIFVPLLYAKILKYFCASTIPLHPRAYATWYSRSWNKLKEIERALLIHVGIF